MLVAGLVAGCSPRCSRTPMGGVPGGNGAVAPNDVSHQAMRGWPGDFCIFQSTRPPPKKSQTQQPHLCLKTDASSRKT